MPVSLRLIRHRFAQAVHLLNEHTVDELITLDSEDNRQIIVAAWLYIQTKTLLSNASATYLPKPSENPDLKIKGDLPPLPPSGWTPPAKIRLKPEEVLASNHILEEEGSLADVSSWFVQETSNLDSDDPGSDTSPRASTSAKSNSRNSGSTRRTSTRLRNSNPISHENLLYHLSRGDTVKESFPSGIHSDPGHKAVYKELRRLRTTMTPQATKIATTPSADSTPTNPRRSTRLSGVQLPSSSNNDPSEHSDKRSISPNEPIKRKRPRLTSQFDKSASFVDPKIPGLPWRHLTPTMRERAIGYLKRNIIHRQSVTCVRCTQQTVAREKIDEDCITMFDSQGGSIACFRCGYRQLTCSFANGALIPDTPVEIEPSESSQSETVQTTTGSSDSTPKVVAEPSSQSTTEIPRRLSQAIADQETPNSSSHLAADVVTTPTSRTPEPSVIDKDVPDQGQESPSRDMVELRVEPADTFPDDMDPPSPHSSFNNDISFNSQLEGGSLASVLRENPAVTVAHRRSALRTYSRNDRTTLPSVTGTQTDAEDLESGESDRPFTLRPAFSREGSFFPDFDDENDIDDQRVLIPQMRSCSLRELPRPAAEELHESVHQFRALLHTHQGIIKMRQQIFSLLHANDSALRHSRQSLLNATTQLKQYPFPWDIPNEPPFDGLKELADDLVCAWSNGFDEREAYEGIRKYDRAQMEVDRHAVDPVEEDLDPYYYPNIAKVWSSGAKDMIE